MSSRETPAELAPSLAARRTVHRVVILVLAYICTHGLFVALVNPPGIGPDERGHVQYLQTFATHGPTGVTGVEARQPLIGYLPTIAIWYLLGGPADPVAQEFAPTRIAPAVYGARVVSSLWSVVTAYATWQLVRVLVPEYPWMGLLTVILTTLAPGYLYVMASVSNEPVATALATLTILASARLTLSTKRLLPPTGRLRLVVIWISLGALAVATKLTTVPVIGATVITVGYHFRAQWRPIAFSYAGRTVLGILGCTAIVAYGYLLTFDPSSSYAATAARIWPQAIIVGVVSLIWDGGPVEAVRTFWHAYDYSVHWDRNVDAVLTGTITIGLVVTTLGLVRRATSLAPTTWLPLVAQLLFVVARYGIGTVSGAMMGGASQAKTFFPAIACIGLLGAIGLTAVVTDLRHLWRPAAPTAEDQTAGRWLALIVFVVMASYDVIGLGASLWHHYAWVRP